MTQEEKAKAYDEAVKRAKAAIDVAADKDLVGGVVRTILPELRESEDERIIRAIIDALYSHTNSINLLSSRGYQMGDIEAWLEKQKETGIQWFKSDNVKNPDKPYIDKAGRFYTTDGRMCYAFEIEKQKDQKDYNKLYEDIGKSEWFKKAYAGKSLGGDDEQKEQNPVEPSDDELQRYQDELHDFKLFATRQAKEHNISISFVHDFEWNNFCAELLSHFNEKQKSDSLTKYVYSKEDKRFIQDCANILVANNYTASAERLLSMFEQRPEWSEEDEKMLTDISWAIRHCAYDDKKKERVMKWFNDDYRKSLRPSWKPSEEQMIALEAATVRYQSTGLESLYEDLKKRM